MSKVKFEWDFEKNLANVRKHGVSFTIAQKAFSDPNRVIVKDIKHSESEQRYFCLGMVFEQVLTVRFTYRGPRIRIIGAGFWREGRDNYEEKNRTLH